MWLQFGGGLVCFHPNVLIASSDLDVQQEVLVKLIDFEPLKRVLLLYILHAKETKVQIKII